MKVKIKKLLPSAVTPTYATDGSGAVDLYAASELDNVYVWSSKPVRTGLSFEIPPGYVMLIFSRSSHGFNAGVRLANCVGVIDSDYRGEVMVKLHQDRTVPRVIINMGDRIAQALLVAIPKIEFEEVNELSETTRGQGGFGSTGR